MPSRTIGVLERLDGGVSIGLKRTRSGPSAALGDTTVNQRMCPRGDIGFLDESGVSSCRTFVGLSRSSTKMLLAHDSHRLSSLPWASHRSTMARSGAVCAWVQLLLPVANARHCRGWPSPTPPDVGIVACRVSFLDPCATIVGGQCRRASVCLARRARRESPAALEPLSPQRHRSTGLPSIAASTARSRHLNTPLV